MKLLICRTIIIYLCVLFAMRLMGKRQLGELQPEELVSTILISNLASISIESEEVPITSSLIPLFLIAALELLGSVLSFRSQKFFNFLSGRPKTVILDGQIDQNALRMLRLTTADLMEALRGKNIFDPREVSYAVIETNGTLSVALRPEKLTDWLGRILCPCLIVLIVVLFAGCLIHPLAAHYGTPSAEYAALPAVQGILYGYQTMDTLAGLNFGAVIALNIRARGVTESRAVEGGTIRAGFIAGGLMLVVYAMLGHAGAETGTVYPGLATGAEVLTALAQQLFGRAGLVLIAAIFVIACFNTCVGLIACVGQYFHQLLPRIPYPALAAFFAVASMLVSNLGLAAIIRLSTPVLNAIYPAAIVLITLSFLPGLERRRAVYPLCVGCTAVQSIAAALPLGPLSALANALPLAGLGFGWVLPAAAGFIIGSLLKK